jgi:hypothetical protein
MLAGDAQTAYPLPRRSASGRLPASALSEAHELIRDRTRRHVFELLIAHRTGVLGEQLNIVLPPILRESASRLAGAGKTPEDRATRTHFGHTVEGSAASQLLSSAPTSPART